MNNAVNASTTRGPIIGREKEGVLLFAGIPYAAPPIGGLRFHAPLAHAPWSEPKDTRKFGPAAPQVATGGMTDAVSPRWSEDCLTLNIQTPALDGSRPVLVWIHGGAYRTGQGATPWYNGTSFATNGDIVVVSINYRLGALGFTDLSRFGSEFATSGVNGTLDQITALMWVRDNIAGFGGDPSKVTIAGESAGGFSVSTLLGCPAAQGLFRAAIPQSGGAQHTLPEQAGEIVADAFLAAVGVDTAEGLQAIDVDEILRAQSQVIADLEGGVGSNNKLGVAVSAFYPVVGNRILSQSPIDAIRQGVGASIPVLTGWNKDETTLWGYGKVDEAKLERFADNLGATAALQVYREQRPDASANDLLIALTTDHMFGIPAIRLAEARAGAPASTWMYCFCWESRAMNGRLKATHALEIPFAFDNLSRPGVDAFIGDGPLPQEVADVMHQTWIRFIREGNPGWQPYSEPDRVVMCFDTESELRNDPRAAERQAWSGLR
ncbi:MAG: carboxylesterase/lipase family protein [Proteobacteria bacterium]|nr:carboxylesterase/lipase family protein [Pseudomonadota bacterium]